MLRKTKPSYCKYLGEKKQWLKNFGKQLNRCYRIKKWKKSNEKIALVKNEKIPSNDEGIAKTLNNFFANVIKLFGISVNDCKVFVDKIRDPTLKAILKYRQSHYSILAIQQ